MTIELTDKERLFLANQYEILGLLKNEDYYSELAEQLREGHKWLYEQSFDVIYPNFPEENANLVLEILELYEVISDSYEALTDKKDIDAKKVLFNGFDGNYETEYMGFVDALKKNNRFVDVIEAGTRNSHAPKAHIYESMLNKWNELDKSRQLTKEQLIEILN